MSGESAHAIKDLATLRRIWDMHGFFEIDDDPLEQSARGGKLARFFGAELPLTAPRRSERIAAAVCACQTMADLGRNLENLQSDRINDEFPWGQREDDEDGPSKEESDADELIAALERALLQFPNLGWAPLPLQLPPWIAHDILTPTCVCTSPCCKEHANKRIVYLFGCRLARHVEVNGCQKGARQPSSASAQAPTLDAADEVADLIAAMSDAAPNQ
jgi:hypothetical protein